MLTQYKKIPTEELIALKFQDEEAFRQAARMAVEHEITVDAPGHNFLIVRKADRCLLASLTCDEQEIVSPEKIPSEESSRLRRFYTQ